jgi:hypothetical protein
MGGDWAKTGIALRERFGDAVSRYIFRFLEREGGIMGKGSSTLERLRTQVLTPEEVRSREAAAEGGADVVAMPDGRLVKEVPERPQPREVDRAPAATWD